MQGSAGHGAAPPDAVSEEDLLSAIQLSFWDAVLLGVVLLAHGYLWWRLVHDTTRPGRGRRRLTALLAHGIGLWDVVARARRSGSSDAAIRDAEPNDLAALVETLPELSAVAFNGGTAAKIGRSLLAGRGLELIALPSSSPLHTVGLAAKQSQWNRLAEWL